MAACIKGNVFPRIEENSLCIVNIDEGGSYVQATWGDMKGKLGLGRYSELNKDLSSSQISKSAKNQ